MTDQFDTECTSPGRYRLIVRGEDGASLMESTELRDAGSARLALMELRASLAADWRYRIVSRGRGKASFVIQLSDPRAACTSRAFSSADAMEREIRRLKGAV